MDRISFDGQVRLMPSEKAPYHPGKKEVQVQIVVESDLDLRLGDQHHVIRPPVFDDGVAIAALLSILWAAVESLVMHPTGTLTLQLEGGRSMSLPSGDRYESWTLHGPDGLMVVSVPEAKLSIFSPG